MKKILMATLLALPLAVLAQPDPGRLKSQFDSLSREVGRVDKSISLGTAEMRQQLSKDFDQLSDEFQTKTIYLYGLLAFFGIPTVVLAAARYRSMRKALKETIPQEIKDTTKEAKEELAATIEGVEAEMGKRFTSFETKTKDRISASGKRLFEEVKAAETKAIEEAGIQLKTAVQAQMQEKLDSFMEMISLHELEEDIRANAKLLVVHAGDLEGEKEEVEKILKALYGFKEIQYEELEADPWETDRYKEEGISAVIFYDQSPQFSEDQMVNWLEEVKADFYGEDYIDIPFTFLVYTHRKHVDAMERNREMVNAANSKFTLYARLMESLLYQSLVQKYATS